jgi:hypothetical protein
VIALVCAMFVAGLFINPPYTFAPEDNLAYADYVKVHQHAASYVEEKYPGSRVLTAWTATDELSKPFLGYVSKPIAVTSIEDFSFPQIQRAQQAPETYDVALVFSTKYVPKKHMWMPAFWRRAQEKYFGLHADLPPEAAAQMLGGTVVFKEERGGQCAAVLVFDRARNAELFTAQAPRKRLPFVGARLQPRRKQIKNNFSLPKASAEPERRSAYKSLRALRKISRNIFSVSLPVFVFCNEGWYEAISVTPFGSL